MHKTLRQLIQHPTPPIVPQEAPQAVSPSLLGSNGEHLIPAAGQNAVPPPQKLYDLAAYPTPFRFLFRRPRNVLTC